MRVKIVLDAGHGYNTAGKRCPDDSMREWEFNSVVAAYAAEELAQYSGVTTKFTHDTTGKTDVALSTRTKTANAWPADVLVSIHANAAAGTWGSANGIETFVYNLGAAQSAKLARAVQAQLIAKTGRRDRGVKAGNLHMVRESKAPAILVECGFMDNREEAALLKTDAYRRKCAEAIVAGIVSTYGLKRKEGEATNVNKDAKDTKVTVIVNGKRVNDGYLDEGTTYTPARAVAEALGASVSWDAKTRTVNIVSEAK